MMQYKDYTAHFDYDRQTKLFHGEISGIHDVVTFQAKSLEKLEKAFRDSVNDYLAFCRDRGEAPQQPRR